MKEGCSALGKLGKNICIQREALGLTQNALAHRAGLHRTYIGGIERGERNLSVLNLCRIAHALEVLPANLMQGVMHTLPDGTNDAKYSKT